MSPAQPKSWRKVLGARLSRVWDGVLDLALVVWVARASVALLALGFLLLGEAPQAQDLLIPLVGSGWLRLAGFFAVVFVFWAMPTHYAARLAIDDDERLDHWLARRRDQVHSAWLEFVMCQGPRLLGALTFVAFVICACRARINYPQFPGADASLRAATYAQLDWFMVWCAAAFALFFVYAVKRQNAIARMRLVHYAERAAAVAAPLIDALDIGRARSVARMRAGYSDSYLGRTMMFAYLAAFMLILWLSPFVLADWLPRAFAVAIILGGWLSVLAYLSVIGRRLRAPLIVALFGGLAIIVPFIGDNHAVRILPKDLSGGGSRIALDAALDAWMKANSCEPAAAARCPRPIIIVAAGGASRAGFFTASVIGELLDKPPEGLDAAKVRNRVFAISSVSGGSVGAVMTVMALARGQPAADRPCAQNREIPLWHDDKVTGWRRCLEALMSGDFLTPGFIGLSFHDMIALRFLWGDRASLLERSWERYARIVMSGTGARQPCPFDLTCPFLSLRGDDKFWLPLLVLNGTSISTGRRIVTTSLAPRYPVAEQDCPLDPTRDGCRLFADTYHFYDLIDAPGGGAVAYDVRLSTAASNSARFPFVSPPGEIFTPGTRKLVDRIADGGYLENFGVLSAYDLVNAIHALHPDLKPFVLVISNDPNLAIDPGPPGHVSPSVASGLPALPTNAADTNFLTDITGLVSGVATTRDARASIGLTSLATLVERRNGCQQSVAHIRVWPLDDNGEQNSTLSMSWWLSKPVQRRLAYEVDPGPRNQEPFKAVRAALLQSNDSCAAH